MVAKDDGGPAFPSQALGSDGLPEHGADYGMSLRDWFASHYEPKGCEIEAAMRRLDNEGRRNHTTATIRAALRYSEADAMLAERKRAASDD